MVDLKPAGWYDRRPGSYEAGKLGRHESIYSIILSAVCPSQRSGVLPFFVFPFNSSSISDHRLFILVGIDKAALRSCEVSPYNSSLGKFPPIFPASYPPILILSDIYDM